MYEQPNRRNFIKLSGAVLGGIATGTTVVAAERTDRFLVDLKGRASVRRLERAGLRIDHDLSEVGLAVVTGAESDVEGVTSNYEPDTVAALDLPVDPVSVDDGDASVDAESATDEPLYPLQWDKQVQAIPEVHEVTRGEGTRVAIIDTGVAAGHSDLDVNEALSQNFTGDGLGAANPAGGYHGTHVAGIVGADDKNETGVVGTAPGTEIVDCRVFSPNELAAFADILAALVYAASINCDVANMSIGSYPVPRQGIGSFYGKVLNRTTTFANQQGTLLVVSAGNDAADLQHDGGVISLPNEAAQAMSIAATGPVGFGWDATSVGDEEEPPQSPALYTNYGTNAVDLAAPGGDYSPAGIAEEEDEDDFAPPWYYDLVLNSVAIPTYEEDSDGNVTGIADVTYTYSWVAGTSMAAPQVAGAAALVKSENPGANPNTVESILERAAAVPDGYGKEYYGAGFLEPLAAIKGDSNNSGNGNGRGKGP